MVTNNVGLLIQSQLALASTFLIGTSIRAFLAARRENSAMGADLWCVEARSAFWMAVLFAVLSAIAILTGGRVLHVDATLHAAIIGTWLASAGLLESKVSKLRLGEARGRTHVWRIYLACAALLGGAVLWFYR